MLFTRRRVKNFFFAETGLVVTNRNVTIIESDAFARLKCRKIKILDQANDGSLTKMVKNVHIHERVRKMHEPGRH